MVLRNLAIETTSMGSSVNSLPVDFNLPEFDSVMETTANDSVEIRRCADDQLSTPSITQTIIFFTLSIITVSLNMTLIVVVLKTKKLRKNTNYIIVSMAGADLLVGLVSEPIWGFALWVDDHDQKYLTAAKFVVHFSLMSSVSHVLVVTLERTIAVLKPIHYRSWVTCARLRRTIACTWFWSFFAAALHFIWSHYSYYLFIVWTGFTVLVIVAVLHCLMLRSLKKATNALKTFSSNTTWYYRNEETMESSPVRRARLRERKRTKLVTIITLVFAICVLPSVVSETLCYIDVITQTIKNSINLMFFLNSFMNPIIFAFREARFRSAVKRICCCSPKSTNTNGSRDHLRLHYTRSDTSQTGFGTINILPQ